MIDILVGVSLVLRAIEIVFLIPQWSVTINEPQHLAAGVACWQFGDFDLYCVNPPLPRMLATALIADEPHLCRDAIVGHHGEGSGRMEFIVGHEFADSNSLDYHLLICRCRLVGVIWATIGGLIVFAWSKQLFGRVPALACLWLWTIDPMITAHAALVTTDIPASVSAVAAGYFFWRYLENATWRNAVYAGVLWGCGLLCKFTLLLLIPTFALSWMIHHTRAHDKPGRLPSEILQLCSIFAMGWCIVVMMYGLGSRSSGRASMDRFPFEKVHLSQSSNESRLLSHMAPAAYVRGIKIQQVDLDGKEPSYLRGEWAPHGWWYFYLYAFAVKTPCGIVMIYFFAILSALKSRTAGASLLSIFPVALLGYASLMSGFTHHLRYVLPAYPFLIVFTGGFFRNVIQSGSRQTRISLALCLLWSSISVIGWLPHQLGYFNEIVGGPLRGWRHLAGSNVDWGQDLIYVRRWLETNSTMQPCHVEVTCFVDPRIYLGQDYPYPDPMMRGVAIVSTDVLTKKHKWLFNHPIVARLGTSIVVFRVNQ